MLPALRYVTVIDLVPVSLLKMSMTSSLYSPFLVLIINRRHKIAEIFQLPSSPHSSQRNLKMVTLLDTVERGEVLVILSAVKVKHRAAHLKKGMAPRGLLKSVHMHEIKWPPVPIIKSVGSHFRFK